MSKIAFLGLGEMGTPMASRLLGVGHELAVWNRTPGRTALLAERGAIAAAAPAEAAAGAQHILQVLSNPVAPDLSVLGTRSLGGGHSAGFLLLLTGTARSP